MNRPPGQPPRIRPVRYIGVFFVPAAIAFGVSQVAIGLAESATFSAAASALSVAAAPTPLMAHRPTRAATTGNPLWAVPLTALSGTRERPLFSPSRRPPPPVVIAAAPPAPPPPPAKPSEPAHPQLTLVGTAVGRAIRVAIFTEAGATNVVRLRVGEAHNGWTLRAIEGREATLEKDHHDAKLALRVFEGAPENAAPAAVPNPAATSASAAATAAQPAGSRPQAAARSNASQPPADANQSAANKDRPGAPAPAWLDGDGQPMRPPPKPKTTADGKPLGPAVWLDGYGRPIGPAPTTWTDGDGQTTAPPPYRWLDPDGNPIVPPARAWRDGDGQLISPPLRQSAAH